MSEKRKYTKKSTYWSNIDKTQKDWTPLGTDESETSSASTDFQSQVVSNASQEGDKTSFTPTMRRRNSIQTTSSSAFGDGLDNIKALKLPVGQAYGDDILDISEACNLCQKAYANIGVFRNAVDVMTEFSKTKIRLRGGNKESRKLVKAWLKQAHVEEFCQQFFREYYRSGNCFIYSLNGNITLNEFKTLSSIFSSKTSEASSLTSKKFEASDLVIPLRFTILDPVTIVYVMTSNFATFNYRKILSPTEVQAIRLKKTDEDKRIYNSLDENAKKQIDSKAFNHTGIYIKLDEKNITPVFYKKQDYEPLQFLLASQF